MNGTDTDRKGKGAAERSQVNDSLEAGQQDDVERAGPGSGQAGTAAPSVVRHGRGLLSDDEDDDDDARLVRGNQGINDDDGYLVVGRGSRQHSLKALVCYFLLILLGIAFIAFAIIHIWVGRFVSEQLKNDAQLIKQRASDALIWQGPDKVQVLEMTRDKTTVQVDMRLGVDVRTVFGWNGTQSSKQLPLTRQWERRLVGWATRRIGQTSMDLPESVFISPLDERNQPMLQFALEDPITLPLHFPIDQKYDPEDSSWLRPVSLILPAEVLEPELLATFINETMGQTRGKVQVNIQEAHVVLGKEKDRSWLTRTARRYGGQVLKDIRQDISFEVPPTPELPDPATLVKLRSYSLKAIPGNSTTISKHKNHTISEPDELLAIYASATILNPSFEQFHELGLSLDIPFAWPYKVFIQSPSNKTELVTLATGVVEPFSIPSNVPHFDVSINGTVAKTSTTNTSLSESLSAFITKYIAGKNNTVHIAFDEESPFSKSLPRFLTPLLTSYVLSNDIPGLPAEDRDLLKDLKIDHMNIHGAADGGSGFECDGQIQGELVLPEVLKSLKGGLNITSIWPDILLYDGLPPANIDDKMPPEPMPANAFARFKTVDWVDAETFVQEGTNATIMRAMVRNVPLDIVNRGVLQRWLAKIIFSGGNGIKTGIKGLTEARASVRAFGPVELHQLPVLGVFMASKPSYFSSIEELWN